MANELFEALLRFHREVVQPQFDEIRTRMETMRGEMAMKADLQAVRDEMGGLVTKSDLQGVRDEMGGLVTKSDLQVVRDEMGGLVTKADLQAVRDEMATKAEMQAMRAEITSEMQAMRREMVTWPVLMKFHEDVVRPEIEEVRTKMDALATRDEMLTHVDGIYVRFGHLDSEYHALSAAVRRMEEQLKQQSADIVVIRSELVEVRNDISQLAQRVTSLENVLN